MRAAGSSVGSCVMVTSQLSMALASYTASHELRQRARCARAQLHAADPAHEKGARRAAVGAGAQGARHRPGRREGFRSVLAPDWAFTGPSGSRAEGIHLLHEEEVITRLAGVFLLSAAGSASAVDATFTVKVLTPETALKAAQAALARCRANGYQVAVAVTDRMGVVQVMLRDRFAGPHTAELANAKAYTAASLRTNTTQLAQSTQAGRPQSGIPNRPGRARVGGGRVVEAGGSLLGAIGVSGAPGGREDDACAAAGIA